MHFKKLISRSFYQIALLISGTVIASDMVVMNAKVITVNDQQPYAEAFAIKDGHITFVGTNDEVKTHVADHTDVIDAEGLTVMPGFIDTHNHVFEGASEVGGECLLSPNKRLHKQKRELNDCKRGVKNPGDWVMGYGHQLDALWGNSADLNPRQFLDKIFPDNPVVIMEESSHSMIVNSPALSLVGIDENSDHPQGGRLMYDDVGNLNGVLFDNAGDIVMEHAWNSFGNNFQLSYDGLIAGMEESVKVGITTIGDGRLYWQRGWYAVWQEALRNDEIITRVSLRPWIYPDVDFDVQIAEIKKMASGDIHALLVANQVKMYIDGVLHFGTAKVLEPYKWSWQEHLPYGLNYIDPEQLPALLAQLEKIGFGAHIHAIGDGGVREVMDAIDHRRAQGSNQLYSLTHLEMMHENEILRFAELNVHADFQAGATFFDDTSWANFYINKSKVLQMIPMREIYETGANVTFSSDWTVNDINPLVAIANSLRLRKSKGLPDINAAIKAATINGAKALGLDTITGSIEVGKSADFVMLDTDLLKAKPRKIENAAVLLTVLKGEIVYEEN